jgi:hypothetical protein
MPQTVPLYTASASLGREARKGSRSDIFNLTLFWVGTFLVRARGK